jgi:hypothetical protein
VPIDAPFISGISDSITRTVIDKAKLNGRNTPESGTRYFNNLSKFDG